MSNSCGCSSKEWAINPERVCTQCRGFIEPDSIEDFNEWADSVKSPALKRAADAWLVRSVDNRAQRNAEYAEAAE